MRPALAVGALALAMGLLTAVGVLVTGCFCSIDGPYPYLEARAEGDRLVVERADLVSHDDLLVVEDDRAVPHAALRDGRQLARGAQVEAGDVIVPAEGVGPSTMLVNLRTNAIVFRPS